MSKHVTDADVNRRECTLNLIRHKAKRAVAAVVISASAITATYVSATAAPSVEDVEQAEDKAKDLQQQAEEQALQVAAGQEKLEHLSLVAIAAMEVYDEATKAAQFAQDDVWAAQNELQAAQYEVTQTQAQLGRWAADSYQRGADSSTLSQLAALSAGNTGDAVETAWTLDKVGVARSDVATRAQEAQARAAAAQEKAQAAQELAMQRRAAAEEAKKEADAAKGEQTAEVQRLRAELEATMGAAELAATEAERLDKARAAAEAARAEALRNAANPRDVLGEVGSCTGSSLEGHANGKLPVSALCPLWGAPGHFLRADAANAFEKMSQQYARETGNPLCVTDSYRNYETQVVLKRKKPNLAATPGTSNHGWARAIDFCGGINQFGTAAHNWMRLNAPTYGWYHPSWAQKNGSKPEAWHWEYAPL